MKFYMRNPHTGKIRRSKEMTTADASVHNYHLKLNGKHYRWQYKSKGDFKSPKEFHGLRREDEFRFLVVRM